MAGAFMDSPVLLIKNAEVQQLQNAIPEFIESITEQDSDGS